MNRSGTGLGGQYKDQNLGIAPVGHRVTVSTPEYLDIDVFVRCVLARDLTSSQVENKFNDIMQQYFDELRRQVVTEWENTYYSNSGIAINYVNNLERFQALYDQYQDPEILDLALFFPALQAYQTHNFTVTVSRVIIGGRLSESRLIADLDFAGIIINGEQKNFVINQSQEMIYVPRLRDFVIDFVDYIPDEPETPSPCEMVQKTYVTAYDSPLQNLTVVAQNGEEE